MKCNTMLHFIWVFTVCYSTRLGGSSIQVVNGKSANIPYTAMLFARVLETISTEPRAYHDIQRTSNDPKTVSNRAIIAQIFESLFGDRKLVLDDLFK